MDNPKNRNDELTQKPSDQADLQTTDEVTEMDHELLEEVAGGGNGTVGGQA
jgi:hypothetical protein